MGAPAPSQQQLDLNLQLALRNKGVSQATLLVGTLQTLVMEPCHAVQTLTAGKQAGRGCLGAFAPGTCDLLLTLACPQVAVRCRPLLQQEVENRVHPITRCVDGKVGPCVSQWARPQPCWARCTQDAACQCHEHFPVSMPAHHHQQRSTASQDTSTTACLDMHTRRWCWCKTQMCPAFGSRCSRPRASRPETTGKLKQLPANAA